MDGQSITLNKIKIEQLKAILPEVFSERKIDWEKLNVMRDEDITFSYEQYVLNRASKSDAFKVLQAPSLCKLIPAKDESINFDKTKNIVIENMVYELLFKSVKDMNSLIEHQGNYNELVFMLKKASQEIVDAVLKEKPRKVVALDKLFTDNNQLKTNTVLQMRDAGVEFKTI